MICFITRMALSIAAESVLSHSPSTALGLLHPQRSTEVYNWSDMARVSSDATKGWIDSVVALPPSNLTAPLVRAERQWGSCESCLRIPKHACRHIVLLAGMPRAGSTLQELLATRALELLGAAPAIRAYWDWPKHVSMSQRDSKRAYHKEERLWAKLRQNSTVLYKSHEYAAEAIGFCSHTHVLTCHRQLLHEFISAVGGFGLSLDEETARRFVTGSAAEYSQWREVAGALDQRYEDMEAQLQRSYGQIVRWLARRMDLPVPVPIPRLGEVGEANPGIPSSRDAVDAEKALEVMKGARASLKGTAKDPELLGLEWGF